ncbi:MAG: zinc-binding dehydrogenase [Clostridiales bacterium]|jgi:propanol-preferring alcohol dehydrogenase|nr:zinc-binding dehydrogenase [Clostridiales bacterium]
MRGLVFTGVEKMEIRQFPDPKPGAGQVVVDIKCTSLCGSDLHNLHNPNLNHEIIMGHEGAGIVSEVGVGVTLVKPGDRVALYHVVSCGKCKYCMAGYAQFCTEDRRALAGIEHGTDADKIIVKEANCLPLPDDISFAVGAFIGCFAGTSFSAMKKLQPSGMNTVAVFGLGPVGLCGVQYAHAAGARVIGIDGIPERLELAKKLGADEVIDFKNENTAETLKKLTGGRGPDLVYESSGSMVAQKDAINVCAVQGKICMVGFNGPMSAKADSAPMLYGLIGKELTLYGSSIMPRQYHYEIIDFIRAKKIDLEKMITHRFPFEKIEEAMRLFDTGKTGKVVIDL